MKSTALKVFMIVVLMTVSNALISYCTAASSEKHGNEKKGVASWYGHQSLKIKKHTADGSIFRENSLTCASWDYRFGTKLKVTNLKNGKTVICEVNDRGPAKKLDRIIDLSKGAFKRIGSLKEGLVHVSVTPL